MTKAKPLKFRQAAVADAGRLAELTEQLGYPATSMEIQKRLQNLNAKPDENVIYVAEINGKVVGWVHVHIYSLLVDDSEAEIGGLVVADGHRGRGIGRQLMDLAETWAREKNCSSMYLRSNVIRERAHDFYKRIGYQVVKSQYAFRKSIS